MPAPLRQAPHTPHASAPPAPRQKGIREGPGNFSFSSGPSKCEVPHVSVSHLYSISSRPHTHTREGAGDRDACSASGCTRSPASPRMERSPVCRHAEALKASQRRQSGASIVRRYLPPSKASFPSHPSHPAHPCTRQLIRDPLPSPRGFTPATSPPRPSTAAFVSPRLTAPRGAGLARCFRAAGDQFRA